MPLGHHSRGDGTANCFDIQLRPSFTFSGHVFFSTAWDDVLSPSSICRESSGSTALAFEESGISDNCVFFQGWSSAPTAVVSARTSTFSRRDASALVALVVTRKGRARCTLGVISSLTPCQMPSGSISRGSRPLSIVTYL